MKVNQVLKLKMFGSPFHKYQKLFDKHLDKNLFHYPSQASLKGMLYLQESVKKIDIWQFYNDQSFLNRFYSNK
jgi:hypothetical protein